MHVFKTPAQQATYSLVMTEVEVVALRDELAQIETLPSELETFLERLRLALNPAPTYTPPPASVTIAP